MVLCAQQSCRRYFADTKTPHVSAYLPAMSISAYDQLVKLRYVFIFIKQRRGCSLRSWRRAAGGSAFFSGIGLQPPVPLRAVYNLLVYTIA